MAWLQIGENESTPLECAPYEQSLFIQALTEIRQLTVLEPEGFYPRMVKLCGDSGVALVMVEELRGTHIHGAARWLNPHKALIQLSLRGKRNDLFWFSFFHEAAHILKGSRKHVFVDEENGATGEDEQIADELASEILIPKADWTH
jgi:HTH-type transcriptional regulator/antitoxin HigA